MTIAEVCAGITARGAPRVYTKPLRLVEEPSAAVLAAKLKTKKPTNGRAASVCICADCRNRRGVPFAPMPPPEK